MNDFEKIRLNIDSFKSFKRHKVVLEMKPVNRQMGRTSTVCTHFSFFAKMYQNNCPTPKTCIFH